MNENCEACALGPSNVDGHAALMVHSMAAAGVLFKCRRCELTWMRSYFTEGRYNWTRLADRAAAAACIGILMPSTGTTPAAVAEVSSVGGETVDHWLATQHSWKHTSRRPR
jgi:hypothetical protein